MSFYTLASTFGSWDLSPRIVNRKNERHCQILSSSTMVWSSSANIVITNQEARESIKISIFMMPSHLIFVTTITARQHCRLTICIELVELTNNNTDTETRCLVYQWIALGFHPWLGHNCALLPLPHFLMVKYIVSRQNQWSTPNLCLLDSVFPTLTEMQQYVCNIRKRSLKIF